MTKRMFKRKLVVLVAIVIFFIIGIAAKVLGF